MVKNMKKMLFQDIYCNYLQMTYSKSFFCLMMYLRNLSRSSLLHRDHETSPRFCPLIHSPDMIWRPSAQDGWSLSWFIPMLSFEVIKNKPKHNKITSCFQIICKLKLLQDTMKSSCIKHIRNLFDFFSMTPSTEVHGTCVENILLKFYTERWK